MIPRLTVCLAVFVCLPLVAAQSPRPTTIRPPSTDTSPNSQTGSIKGRIVLENGAFMTQGVRLTLLNIRGTQATLFTDNQGQFEITGLTPGEYTLEVEGDRLVYEPSSERVEVRRGAPSAVTIALKEKSPNQTTRPASSVTSVAELSNDIPPKARKEFERATALSREGKAVEAIERMRKAVEIYPKFMMAHNDLGVLLLNQGQVDEAIAEFLRTLEIDAKAFNPHLNLGIAYVRQQRFAEAADVLRKALTLDSTSPSARLFLGIALKELNEWDTAERELRDAYQLGGDSYAEALFHLGEIFMSRGDRGLAQQALESYLRAVPQAANAARARHLLDLLR